MGNDKRQLAAFLKEVAGWDWPDFLKAEKDPTYTTRQSIVFALIRAAAMEDLRAITISLNRLDGKVETPVQVVMPKVYYLYPNAKEVDQVIEVPEENIEQIEPSKEVAIFTEEEEDIESPTQSFRDTMEKMVGKERTLPTRIIACQEAWEAFSNNRGRCPTDEYGNPISIKVSSVVAARLIQMAQKRNMKALDAVFDQLDGKLVETIRVVGEDMYIMQFSEIAPAGATKNEDGIYQVEAPKMARMWGERLDPAKKNVPISIIEDNE